MHSRWPLQPFKLQNSNRRNECMDGDSFHKWVTWWYGEFQKLTLCYLDFALNFFPRGQLLSVKLWTSGWSLMQRYTTALCRYVKFLTILCGGITENIAFYYRQTPAGLAFDTVICPMRLTTWASSTSMIWDEAWYDNQMKLKSACFSDNHVETAIDLLDEINVTPRDLLNCSPVTVEIAYDIDQSVFDNSILHRNNGRHSAIPPDTYLSEISGYNKRCRITLNVEPTNWRISSWFWCN